MVQNADKQDINQKITLLLGLFGPPPLLASEDVLKFEATFAQYLLVVRPKDFVELVLVRDYTLETFKKIRWERIQAAIVQAEMDRHKKSKKGIASPADPADFQQQVNDAAKAGESNVVLDLLYFDVIGAATTASTPDTLLFTDHLEQWVRVNAILDRMISDCVKRRQACRVEIEMYRTSLGDQIESTEKTLVGIVQGQNSETTLVPDGST